MALLCKAHKEEINNFVNTTNAIAKLYDRLFKIEVEDNKNNESYIKTLNYLKIALEVEEKEYNDFFKKYNYNIPVDIYAYFVEKSTNYFEKSNHGIEKLELNIFERIISQLDNCTTRYNCFDTENISKKKIEQIKFNIPLSYYINRLYLQFSEENKNFIMFKKSNEYFSKLKYLSSFTDANIEILLVNNFFDLSKIDYLDFNSILPFSKGDRKKANMYRNSHGTFFAIESLNELVNVSDINSFDSNKIMNIIHKITKFKVYIFILDENIADDIYNLYKTTMKMDTSEEINNIIEEIFENKILYEKNKKIKYEKSLNIL